jgi:hypothetical protein
MKFCSIKHMICKAVPYSSLTGKVLWGTQLAVLHASTETVKGWNTGISIRKEMTHHGIRQHSDPNDTILYIT